MGCGCGGREGGKLQLDGHKRSEQFLQRCVGKEEGDLAIARALPRTAPALASSALDSNGSTFRACGERPSVSNYLPNFDEEIYRSDPPNDGPEGVESANTLEAPKAYDKLIGVQPFRGRFEVRLQKDGHAYTSIFSSQKEAVKAYDNAAYKLNGPSAKTTFELTEKERLHIEAMEWEDLLLEMQLQDLAQSSPSRLGFPGVYYKEEDRSWMVKIRIEKKAYLGYYLKISGFVKEAGLTPGGSISCHPSRKASSSGTETRTYSRSISCSSNRIETRK